jgi:hypothetical protein
VILFGGVGCALILLTVIAASTGGRVRGRDVLLVLAALGVLLMPVAHFALAFLGFVLNPRHFAGDYWSMQRDARVAAVVIVLAMAAVVIGAGIAGGISRPRSLWRLGLGAVEAVAGVAFAGVELAAGLQAVADATSRIGTFPM